MGQTSLYDSDFYLWTQTVAELIRTGKMNADDIEHTAEELEDMGKRDRRELYSRMRVLVMHLMKWAAQPQMRCSSWTDTISEQRIQIDGVLEQSPSLRPQLVEELQVIFDKAAGAAAIQTKIPVSSFQGKPAVCLDRLLDDDYLPDWISELID